jgi:PIN domain nuclease of toxin-antitoxin system
MTGLLDTHTFIWWDSDPAKLSAPVLAFLQDPANKILLSVASVWEMVIKHQLGKLSLRLPLQVIVSHQQGQGIQLLPIMFEHVLAVETLPLVHKDPFDRILIAQANIEKVELITSDSVFAHYPVKVFW